MDRELPGAVDLDALARMIAHPMDDRPELHRAGRVCRRADGLRGGLESMIEAEIGGRLAQVQTEARVEPMSEAFGGRLATRPSEAPGP